MEVGPRESATQVARSYVTGSAMVVAGAVGGWLAIGQYVKYKSPFFPHGCNLPFSEIQYCDLVDRHVYAGWMFVVGLVALAVMIIGTLGMISYAKSRAARHDSSN